jgi:hypothetical protein
VDQNSRFTSRPFLLMRGGPLFNIQKRLGLIKEDAFLTKRRALVVALLTWVPLLLLSALQGRAFGHSVQVPFLRDFSAYTRFLLAIPLLVLGENILGPRIAGAAAHFIKSGLVLEKDFPQFDKAVEDSLRWRDSAFVEIALAILAYVFTFIAFTETAIHVSTWYATQTDHGGSFTWAGLWLLGFSVPLFQFLILRWLWRLFLWFRFLAYLRRLDLQLFPTHPDRAGGLGFVGEAQRFFGIVLFAFSVGSAGVMANDIVYDKIPLKNFAPAIAVYVVVALIIVLGPLVIFSVTLLKTKRLGLHEYGRLATTYTGSFQKKWIEHKTPDPESLLGTSDIQSLADLGHSYELVEQMRPLPIDPLTVIHLVLASLLPMMPLLLTVMPLKDMLELLLKIIR